MTNFEIERTRNSRGVPERRVQEGYLGDSNQGWNHTPQQDQSVEEVELVRLLRIAWARRFVILAACLVCAAIGLFVAMKQTPIYQSSATVELLGINENFMNMRDVDPNTKTLGSSTTAQVQTEIQLLRSRALVDRVVQKLGMVQPAPADHGTGFLSHLNPFASPRPQKIDPTKSAVDGALANLRIEQIGDSNMLRITYDDSDPERAANFVNMIAKQAIQLNLEERGNLNQRVGGWLSKQVELLRNHMEQAESELQAYSRKAGLLYTDGTQNVADTQLQQLEAELAAAQGARIQSESQYTLAKGADPDTLPQVLDNGPLKSYQGKLVELERQKAELEATMTPENPKVKKVAAQITQLQKTIARERKDVLTRIGNEYNTAKKREALLTAAYQKQTGVVSDQAQKAIHYNTLKHEVDTTRELYEAMLRRVNDAEVVSAIRASDLRVVDAGSPAAAPHSPDKPLYTGIGLISGLLIGLMFVFVQDQKDRTIQQPGHSALLLDITELGVIPSAKASGAKLLSGPPKPEQAPSGPKSLLTMNRKTTGLESAVAASGHSLFTDSFRGVVNSILFSGGEHVAMRTLLVSSPNEGEGKTTSVCNLGAAFAEIGRRVLLIDADFRKPRLHDVFSVPNDRGLLNLLSGDEGSLDPLDLVRETGTERLSILPAGMTSHPLSTLIHSERLGTLLNRLRSQYDLILIDSAPLLLVPESRVLARSADALVLVLRAGVTTVDVAVAARRRATEDHVPLIGTILNDWKPETTGYYGYYPKKRA